MTRLTSEGICLIDSLIFSVAPLGSHFPIHLLCKTWLRCIVLNRKIISGAFVSTGLLILGFFPETSPSCTTLEGDDDGSDLEIMPEQTSASNPLHESFRTDPQRLWCFFCSVLRR